MASLSKLTPLVLTNALLSDLTPVDLTIDIIRYILRILPMLYLANACVFSPSMVVMTGKLFTDTESTKLII